MKASSIKHCLQVCLVLSEGGNHAAEISSGAAVAMTPPMPLRRVPRWQKRVNLSIPRMGNQSTKHLQYQFTRFRYSEMCKAPEGGAHEGGGGLDEDAGAEAAGENPGRGEEEDGVAEAGPDVELRQGRVTPAEYLHRGHSLSGRELMLLTRLLVCAMGPKVFQTAHSHMVTQEKMASTAQRCQ